MKTISGIFVSDGDDGILGYLNTYDFDGNYLTWTTDGAKAGTGISEK